MDRFMRYALPEPNSGCWLWTASTFGGYGQFGMGHGHVVGAHRAAWLLLRGPIPDDLFVLHKCDVKVCVNPDHLFLGTNKDNLDDFVAKYPGRIGQHNARKTECIWGHEFTDDNTGRDRRGHRFCRQCARDKALRYLARRKRNV